VKILQVSLRFPPAPAYGGVPRTTYLVSKELVKRGHDVTVFTTDAYDANSRLKPLYNPTNMDGITVYRFRTVSNYLAYRNVPIAPAMALALRRQIESFDLVHLREHFHFQAVLVHHYATKKSIPYILQAHGSLPRKIEALDSKRALLSKSQPKNFFDNFFGHSILKDASKIIASSQIESDLFQTAFADFPFEKVVCMPNYVDLKSYQNLPQRGQFRAKHAISERAKTVLFLGRIHPIKNIETLLAAFSNVKRTVNCPVKLVIAGPDEGHLQTLKSLARQLDVENDMVFPGPLYEREKLEAYVDADVFVLPSHYESFGNVALEALACGTPVIVTNNCGVSEWISGDVGYIVESNEEELCNALSDVLQNEQLSRKLGSNGKTLVEKEFGWDKGILQLEELYEAVISGNCTENIAGHPFFSIKG
jgi:glycosyltransferase involved in cell wall biosynthesis